MKKVISLLLLISTLLGVCSIFAACKKDPTTDPNSGNTGGKTEAVAPSNKETVIADFGDNGIVTSGTLTLDSTPGKRAPQTGAITLSGAAKNAGFVPTITNLSDQMEIDFWAYNSASTEIPAKMFITSEDAGTAGADYYYVSMSFNPGWHRYRFPISEFSTNNSPLGWTSIGDISFSFEAGKNGTILLDTFCANSQKIGTVKGFNYAAIKKAVCFYEDSGFYFVDRLRYSMNENDESVVVRSDNDTMYVPVAVLAEYRGATDITVSEDGNKVSFTYNGTPYEFAVGNSVEYTGIASGNRPGVALSSKIISVGGHVLVPMEYCATVFGFQLFYSEMGLAIFSDVQNIYDEDKDFHTIYSLIEDLCYNRHTGVEMLKTMDELYPEDQHTRLFANQATFDRLKSLIDTDPTYTAWFKRYSAAHDINSDEFNSPTVTYYLSDGYRLLSVSREFMERVVNQATMYKLTDDPVYAERVWKELDAVSRFVDPVTGEKSWHPEHFLDTGEIMYGFALGYDWCYDYLTDEQRDQLEAAAWEMGFGAALGFGKLYDWWADPANMTAYEAVNGKYIGYTNPKAPYPNGAKRQVWHNNWSTVCNGGMVCLALAFANAEVKIDGETIKFREYSEILLECATEGITDCLKESYAPDGGYPEGPGYWDYGTRYAAILFTALKSATGSEYGYFNCAGFGESFYFICNVCSTGYGNWNYHDAGVGKATTDMFSMYAKLSGDTNLGAYRYDNLINSSYQVSHWDLLFYDPANYGDSIEMTLDNCYYGIQTVTFRSDWTEDAMFCGLHGGANAASHGQLDIGNFILEYQGSRFFIDMGADEYNLTGYSPTGAVTYFSSPYRYWYYRNRAEGHNTLIVNPKKVDTSNTNASKQYSLNVKNYDQDYNAVAKILGFESGKTMAYAVIDMSCAYAEATAGKRGMWVLNDRSTVIIQDEITFSTPSEVLWMAHLQKGATYTISADKQSAVITLDGLSVLCQIVTKNPAMKSEFSIVAADYLPVTELSNTVGEYPRNGYYKLVATTTGVRNYNFAVVCSLLTDGAYEYTWTDINRWSVD